MGAPKPERASEPPAALGKNAGRLLFGHKKQRRVDARRDTTWRDLETVAAGSKTDTGGQMLTQFHFDEIPREGEGREGRKIFNWDFQKRKTQNFQKQAVHRSQRPREARSAGQRRSERGFSICCALLCILCLATL